VRATVLSMNGQADALGQVAGGPLIGAIGSAFSMRVALVFSGLLITPALALYTRTFKPRHAQADLARPDQGAVI
jgi:DHA3 family tetracycline resistance protein-like MFS transporter